MHVKPFDNAAIAKSTHIHTYIATYIQTYIHTYKFIDSLDSNDIGI